MSFYYNHFIKIILLLLPQFLLAQAPDTSATDTSEIDIIWINKFRSFTTPEGETRELLGNVHLKQRDMHIWCDTGYIYPGRQVTAFGNVELLQGDSLRMYSDSLFYDGNSRQAILKKDVVLKDPQATMYTSILYYDMNTRIARYPHKTTIIGDSAQLISRSGYYDANTSMAYFNDSVTIAHPNYKLYASDTLAFNMNTETAYFYGPTYIYDTAKLVYCERGYFDSKRNKAEFAQNAYYVNRTKEKSEKAAADRMLYDGSTGSYWLIGNAYFKDNQQEARADTIVYDGRSKQYDFRGHPVFSSTDSTQKQSIVAEHSTYNSETETFTFWDRVRVEEESKVLTSDSLDYSKTTGLAIAKGNVVIVDTVANTELYCGEAYYNNKKDSIQATKNPVLRTLLNQDSLWLTADTLISVRHPDNKEKRILHAFRHARFFKKDIQGLADSLVYNEQDSFFCFYQNPVLWVDSVQFIADTILALMVEKRIDRVHLHPNALIVSTEDQVYFNQIRGKEIWAYFKNSQIQNVDIQGNGETVYYALDGEGAYLGVNDVDCSDMRIYFTNAQVQRIKFTGEPKAVLYPMGQAQHPKLALKGFVWKEADRPKDKWAIFGNTRVMGLPE